MGRLFTWYILLNKRLFHRWSFILVILLAPVIVLCITVMTGSDKGIYRILLYSEEDGIDAEITAGLMDSESVIRYEGVASKDDGYRQIADGSADALWIFDSDIKEKLEKAAKDYTVKPVVTVIEREESTAQMIARERLYGVLYPYYNYEIYRNFVKNDLESGDRVSEEELKRYYEDEKMSGSLFTRIYSDGERVDEDTDYLLMPVRGVLAIWLVLCLLVSCMYYMTDVKRGLFDRISARHKLLIETGYHHVMLIIALIIMISGIIISGIGTSLINEAVCLTVFAYTSMAYCCIIRRLCRRTGILGALIPVLVIIMIGLSPVFISVRELQLFRFLQPVTLYIRSIHSIGALIEMTVYGGILWVSGYILRDMC